MLLMKYFKFYLIKDILMDPIPISLPVRAQTHTSPFSFLLVYDGPVLAELKMKYPLTSTCVEKQNATMTYRHIQKAVLARNLTPLSEISQRLPQMKKRGK